MQKKLLEELEEKLETQKTALEKELEKFAQKDKKLKGDWDTRFPNWNGGESGGAALETAADEVEEYSTLLSLEHSLETRLRDVNSALEKIKKGTYGKCDNCGKEIPEERLKIHPEARFCIKCETK